MLKSIVENGWTTGAAIATILWAIAGAARLILDGDPSTNPDWGLVMGEITIAIGLLRAKDG